MAFDIDKVAELARLSLKPEERQKLEKDIEAILGYVKKLESLDTKDIQPMSHVLDLENVFRSDERKPSDVRGKVLQHAPLKDGKFFKVPKVVERE